MFERKSARESAKPRGGGGAGNRKRAPRNPSDAAQKISAGNAEAPLAGAQACVRLGMAYGEKLEFEREEREAAILRDLCVMLAQRAEEFRWSLALGEQRVHFGDALANPSFEQREENIFLTFKIGVKSAARVAGQRSDIFQPRGLKPVACKDSFRGEQKLPSGSLGARLLARGGCRSTSRKSILSTKHTRVIHDRSDEHKPETAREYMPRVRLRIGTALRADRKCRS